MEVSPFRRQQSFNFQHLFTISKTINTVAFCDALCVDSWRYNRVEYQEFSRIIKCQQFLIRIYKTPNSPIIENFVRFLNVCVKSKVNELVSALNNDTRRRATSFVQIFSQCHTCAERTTKAVGFENRCLIVWYVLNNLTISFIFVQYICAPRFRCKTSVDAIEILNNFPPLWCDTLS